MPRAQSICNVCGQRVATVFITRVVNGLQEQDVFCDSCARTFTVGEEWLQSVAESMGLSATASLDDVVRGMMEQMTASGAPLPHEKNDPLDAFSDLTIEADIHITGEFSSHEYSSDEDEADDFAEAWEDDEDAELHQLLPYLEESDDEISALDEPTSPFEEVSFEAIKSIWFGSPAESSVPSSDETAQPENANNLIAERCTKCGTTWDRIREDGRTGCAHCYVTFHDRLLEVMKRVQREAQHSGKAPRAALRRHRRLEHLRTRRDHRLEMLNRRLQEAIKAENYEVAAQLRDKIKIVSSTIVSDQT